MRHSLRHFAAWADQTLIMNHTDITTGPLTSDMPPWPLSASLWALVGCSALLLSAAQGSVCKVAPVSVFVPLCPGLASVCLLRPQWPGLCPSSQPSQDPTLTQCGPSRQASTSREFGILQKDLILGKRKPDWIKALDILTTFKHFIFISLGVVRRQPFHGPQQHYSTRKELNRQSLFMSHIQTIFQRVFLLERQWLQNFPID